MKTTGDSRTYKVGTGTAGVEYRASRDPADVAAASALTRDVAFNRHSMNPEVDKAGIRTAERENHSPFDNGHVLIGDDGLRVGLVQKLDEEAFRRTCRKAVLATLGLEPGGEAGADDSTWEEMLKGGLQTALETQVVVFEVAGASRTCTHQLVRSRRAAFHQQSQRASWLGRAPESRMPESVWRNPRARQAWLEALDAAHTAYRVACDEDISYQDARFVLPEATTSYILLEYPLREFLNVYAYRACSMFQWEIVAIMRACRDLLVEAHPWLAPYIRISCEAGRRCTFQGWESVEGQCPLPWARDAERTYKPSPALAIRRAEGGE